MSSENHNADPQQEQPSEWKKLFEQYWQRLNDRAQAFYELHQHQLSLRNVALASSGVVVSVWLGLGFYRVDSGYRGVETLMGAYSVTTGPGSHWHTPWPFGRVTLVNVGSPRAVEFGLRVSKAGLNVAEAPTVTRDQQLVNSGWSVQYQINDARDYLFNVRNPDLAIKHLADSIGRAEIARHEYADVFRDGGAQVAGSVKAQLQKLLDQQRSGIQVVGVRLAELMPPDAAKQAFEDAKRAKEESPRLRHDAEIYANEQITKARSEAARLRRDAESYASDKVAKTQGETARFEQLLEEYVKNPAVVRKQLYLESQEKVLAATRKIIVSTDQLPGLYFAAPAISNAPMQASETSGNEVSAVDQNKGHRSVRGELRPSRSKP